MKTLIAIVTLAGLSVFAADAQAFHGRRSTVVVRSAPAPVVVNGGYGNAFVAPGGATVIQSRSGIFGGRRQTIIVQ